MQLHPQEDLLQQARALQQSEAFDEYRQRRVVVEHRLVQLGIRQARYFGRAKTKFQLYLAALCKPSMAISDVWHVLRAPLLVMLGLGGCFSECHSSYSKGASKIAYQIHNSSLQPVHHLLHQ